LAGSALIMVGFAFKVAAVPFHMWTPDVYQGAPTPVTAFMAAGAKIAGFAALMRVFSTAFPSLAADLTPILAILAALTMIVGNVVAVSQTNVKRMLAYSSIAHAGYILMAFVAFGNPELAPDAIAAGLFYLLTYAITNFGSWGIVIALEKENGKGLELGDYAGLGRKHPLMAAAMTVFMLSLTGIPPTLGLVGKLYLFRVVVEGGRRLLLVGDHRCPHLAYLSILLPASRCLHVYERWRCEDHLRIMAQSVLGYNGSYHGRPQPRS